MIMTWETTSLENLTFLPQRSTPIKSIFLQNFLLIFNYNGAPEEKLLAFDLEEKKWLPVKLAGDTLELKEESSICVYDNKTVIVSGISSNGKEGILNMLIIEKDSNGTF